MHPPESGSWVHLFDWVDIGVKVAEDMDWVGLVAEDMDSAGLVAEDMDSVGLVAEILL